MAKKRKAKKATPTGNPILFVIKKTCIASVIGTILFFVLCSAASFIIYKIDAEPSCYSFVLLIISGICGLICGIAAILPIKRNGLVTGMASVIPAFFITFAIITLLNKSAISNIGWASLGIMTICGGIGGIIGNKK